MKSFSVRPCAQGFRGFFYGLRFRALAAATIISLQFSVYGQPPHPFFQINEKRNSCD